MTDQELELRLAKAVSRAVPDDLEEILARCGAAEEKVVPLQAQPRKRPEVKKRRWMPAVLAACLVLAVLGGGGGYYYQVSHAVASVISLDVNPSIALTVNRQEKVLSAQPMNDDAAVVLEGMELKGTQLDVALNAIVGSLLKNGYVDELANSILITVEDDDAARGTRLQQELTAQADAILAGAQVNGAILSQTIQNSAQLRQQAEEYGISAGKAALIQTIVDGSGGLHTFEELVGLSINELNLLYTSMEAEGTQTDPGTEAPSGEGESTGSGTVSSGLQSTGQASDGAYIGTEAALAAALSHAGLSAADVTVKEIEYDYEDGRMVYELEFCTSAGEYEYDIDALTGEIVKQKQELYGGSTGQSGGGSSASGTGSGAETGGSTSGGSTASGDIGGEAAKAAAFAHAGVDAGQASSVETERDYDDGHLEYEVQFWVDSTKYEYKIDGGSGAVLESEKEEHGRSQPESASEADDIGGEAAMQYALAHAGVSQDAAHDRKVDRDYEDGRLEYEVEFEAGGREYEYVIDGTSGAVLSHETD